LVVEVDDQSHELKRTADARRDRNIARLGYRVLRLPAELVRNNVEEAIARIVAARSVAT
jgi:very-short-patch-repair endonuclease